MKLNTEYRFLFIGIAICHNSRFAIVKSAYDPAIVIRAGHLLLRIYYGRPQFKRHLEEFMKKKKIEQDMRIFNRLNQVAKKRQRGILK